MYLQRGRLKSVLIFLSVFAFFVFFIFNQTAGGSARGVLSSIFSWASETALGGAPQSGGDVLTELKAFNQNLELENAQLKRQMNISGNSLMSKALSRVLWYDPDPSRKAVRILVTDGAQLVKGEAVLAPGDILVGKINAVFGKTADVILISDSSFKLSVNVGDILGSAQGDGNNAMDINLVPQQLVAPAGEPNSGANPMVGEPVFTAGVGDEIPKGFLVGAVAPVSDNSSVASPFALLKITPAVSAHNLDTVFVALTK